MNTDDLKQQVQSTQDCFETIRQCTQSLLTQPRAVVVEAINELSTTLEELQQQNQEVLSFSGNRACDQSLVVDPAKESRYCLDIKEDKQTTEPLLETEENFRAIFEQAAAGIGQLTLSGKFVLVNRQFSSLLGYTESELLERTVQEITYPDDLEPSWEYARQLLEGKRQTYSLEKRYIRKDQQLQWMHLSVSLLRDSQGNPQYFIAVIKDISECKRVQTQLKQQTQQLEETLQELRKTQAQLIHTEKMSSLGQIVAGVAHEINNPLSFICGNLLHLQNYSQDLLELLQLHQSQQPPTPVLQQAMEEKDLDFLREDLPRLLNSMKTGSDRIYGIVQSLRNFCRDEGQLKTMDIHEGIEHTLIILCNRLQANLEQTAVEVVKEYDNIPRVECYPGKLNQVFMNILSNAIEALEELRQHQIQDNQSAKPCEIRIRTTLVKPEKVVISIADNGPGMSPETLQKIFDPFFTTKSVGQGVGLGLAVSHQIVVNQHQGQLRCMSTLAEGTEFVIELPVVQNRNCC
ncbi:PAS domain S-box protein [Lyngbya aestuarii]|uniref:PAS domain S-box protein n=1 Tax=Lyngbya aestuarii TaxID=118322 RepID=UPI00403D7837